jgi:2-keto-4-pentenoate hydratase/2-oxohepta-3-ene-1,7-dioic acid hydratase in catechol pathway
MKLIRFGEPGRERPGVVDAAGVWRDLSGVVADWAGEELAPEALARRADADLSAYPAIDPSTPRKIVCIGLNYADHAAETGATAPEQPVIFLKASIPTGPNDDVPLPRNSRKTDWEVELGVVIGRKASYVPQAEALDYVAGYCVANDFSEREWQLEGTGAWDKGKGCDGFGPIGPWMVTKDEIPDPHALKLWLDVNGRRMQDSSTGQMVHKVRDIVSFVSRFMSLYPGDVISTGTPPGVGMGQKPPWFLKVGDVVELGIDGLGSQRQRIVASM